MLKNKNLIFALIVVVTLLIGGGVGFFAGTKYQQSKTPQRGQFGNMMFQRGGRMGMGNFAGTRGEIINKDDKSITIKMQDGSTKIIILTSTTMIGKSTAGTVDDLKEGETVMAIGSNNSDGSITAQNIQLNPQGMFKQMASPTPEAQ